MDYNILLDVAVNIGYRLAKCGAETYRIEESVTRIIGTYGITADVFSIPNSLIVGITTPDGKSLTRIRRIGFHGNDLDGVERYNRLSRRICAEKPEPQTAAMWLEEVENSKRAYSIFIQILGHYLGGFGFCILFGGGFMDGLCAGICGILIALANKLLDKMKVNTFFSTMASAFLMAFTAYAFSAAGIASNADVVVIGALMLLVPGLLITNAMRDIIFGDTNSGINRIMQVLLIATAIALGTGVAWNLSISLLGISANSSVINHPYWIQIATATLGSLGFALVFNIHGKGFILCVLGGGLSWLVYITVIHFGGSDILAYFLAAIICATYAEVMARLRKYPAISYLVIAIIPLIPGSGVYYTAYQLARGDMDAFSSQGAHTLAIAGVIAVGILMVSTLVNLWTVWQHKH